MKLSFLVILSAAALALNANAEPKDNWYSTKVYPSRQLSAHDEQIRSRIAILFADKKQCEILLAQAMRAKGSEQAHYAAQANANSSTQAIAAWRGFVYASQTKTEVSPEALAITKANIESIQGDIDKISRAIACLEFSIDSRADRYLDGGQAGPSTQTYDDAATIGIYLRDSGYNDLSEAQVLKVSDFMKANHIKHVSEL